MTVAFTVLAMDAGPVLRQVERPLGGDEQAPELLMELFETGTELLLDALPAVWDGSCEAGLVAQDGEAATKAPKLTREESELRLDEVSAAAAHHRVRGFAPPVGPGCWLSLDLGDGKPAVKAKLVRTRLPDADAPTGGPPSATDDRRLSLVGKALSLACADGSVLEVRHRGPPTPRPPPARARAPRRGPPSRALARPAASSQAMSLTAPCGNLLP